MNKTKIIRVRIQDILRKTGLLPFAEKIRYHLKLWSLKEKNKDFVNRHPDFILPPEDLAFDAYSAPDWNFYKTSGEGTARFLAEISRKYTGPAGTLHNAYEWGCGPARVIRHLPAAYGGEIQVHGSDYNPRSIEWCRQQIPAVSFTLNELEPPLNYSDHQFDFAYCISVFTHLSESTGRKWADELYRVLRPGGILLITTSGDNAYQRELLPGEKKKYEEQGVVVRGQYEEGKKMYLARHNPKYVREQLLKNFEVLEHAPAGFPFIEQDYWIARK